MKYFRSAFIITLQAILLGVELATSYDDQGRQIALALTNLVGTTALLIVDARLQARKQQLSWVTMVMVLSSIWIDALGNFQHFYARYWWYDRVTHTIGGMALSAIAIDMAQLWRLIKKLGVPVGLATWFGFLIGQMVGAIYEMSEWIGDWWFHTERVRSAFDSPRDLFFNLCGGLLVALLFGLRKAKK